MEEEQYSPIFSRRVVYAGFGERLVASIIDSLVLMVPNYAVHYITGSGSFYIDLFINHTLIMPVVLGQIAALVMSWLYMALMESGKNCATIGKMAMGIVVTDANGQQISFTAATTRYFSKIISKLILFVGYFMMLWDDRNQTLHDKLAKTIVTKKQQYI